MESGVQSYAYKITATVHEVQSELYDFLKTTHRTKDSYIQ